MFRLSLFLCVLLFLFAESASARTYTDAEARAAWNDLKKKPVTEPNFEAVCDLAQIVGRSNINLYFEIINEYLPIVRKTGDRRKIHVLLMTMAKTKVAMGLYPDAETIYQQVHANAGDSLPFLRTALVGTVILYSEWGQHPDSLDKYFSLAGKQFGKTGDREALSFVYTFKALSLLDKPDSVRWYLENAIRLAQGLPDKNALFTARYNYALAVLSSNPQQEITEFERLLDLAGDSSLVPNAKLYSGRLYSFGLAAMSVYYQLTQLNLLLTDFENAGKYGQLFYDMTVAHYPTGADIPYLSAELSIVKSYQGRYAEARRYLDTSLSRFGQSEDSIPYAGYYVAAGMLAEHEGTETKAVDYFQRAYKIGKETYGLLLMPPGIDYAHALTLSGRLSEAGKVFSEFGTDVHARRYTALGFYYYKYYADYLKSKKDYPGYTAVLDTFYSIKDSLTNLNQYRAIQEIQTKMHVQEEEAQIDRLGAEKRSLRRDRLFFLVLSVLSGVIIVLFVAFARHRYKHLSRQHRIDVMQGMIEAEENERRKIADQLHDQVGSELALATLNISAYLERAPSDDKLEKALDVLGMVSGNIRDLSHRLTPLVIEKYGFPHAVEDMVQTINLSGKLHVDLIVAGFKEGYALPLLNDVYRILQELLHNVLKHARATNALVEIVAHEDALSIMVEDDGIGLGDAEGGMGLKTIRSKIAYLKGKIDISTKVTGGVLIVMDIPTT